MRLQKNKTPAFSIFKSNPAPKPTLSTHDYIENFYAFVNYLVRLRRDGDIDDSVFEALIKQASSSFIENEISSRVDRVLESKFSIERLLTIL